MAEVVKKKVKRDKIPRVSMPEQEPAVRARNFLEVPTGYTPEMAMKEAHTVHPVQKAGLCCRLSGGNRYTRVYQAD